MEERLSPNKGGVFKRYKKALRVKGQQLLMEGVKQAYKPAFTNLKYFCFFFGYPRSSHSLLGALLDAHPHALIAHEQDAFRYVYHGFTREQLYTLLARNAIQKSRSGRIQTGYHYTLPNQYQGQWKTLKVIGDKKGANTARWLQAYPFLLEAMRGKLKESLKAVHVTRNPYDNIATIAKRKVKWQIQQVDAKVLEAAKNEYVFLSQSNKQLHQQLGDESCLHLSSENLVKTPQETLSKLLDFLELEPTSDYLADCESLLFNNPREPRWQINWPQEVIQEIESLMADNPWLKGYATGKD